MARLKDEVYRPIPANRETYDVLYREYLRLHDYFGRGENDVMKTLAVSARRRTGRRARRGRRPDRCASRPSAHQLVDLHAELPRHGLVAWTSGNVSARDQETGLVAIKPSGVRYEDLTADSMVVVDIDGRIVEGAFHPSSDTASHLYIYRHRDDVHGVVHTHSRYATAFAAVGRPIPVYLTAQADEFGGEIPCAPFSLIGDEAIGELVVAGHRRVARDPAPAARGLHGRPDATAAVKAAVMVEDIAATVWAALQIGTPAEPSRRHRRAPPPALHHRLRPAATEPIGVPMRDLGSLEVWFVTGSQHLYGPETLETVARQAAEVAAALDASSSIPVRVVAKPVVTDADGIRAVCQAASADPACVGVIDLDAHVLAGQDVDRRARCPPASAAPPAHAVPPRDPVGRRSTWTS